METIELKTAILHSLDMNLGMPVVSQVEVEPTDFLKDVYKRQASNSASSEEHSHPGHALLIVHLDDPGDSSAIMTSSSKQH